MKPRKSLPCDWCGCKNALIDGQWARQQRIKAGYGLREFAKRMKVSAGYLSLLESNKRPFLGSLWPRYEHALKASK